MSIGCGTCGVASRGASSCSSMCSAAAVYCGDSPSACGERRRRREENSKSLSSSSFLRRISCPSHIGHHQVMVDLSCVDPHFHGDPFGGLGCGAGGSRFCRFCGGNRWKPCAWGRSRPRTRGELDRLLEWLPHHGDGEEDRQQQDDGVRFEDEVQEETVNNY